MELVTEEVKQVLWAAVKDLRTGDPTKTTVDHLLQFLAAGVEIGESRDSDAIDVLKEVSEALWGRRWNSAAHLLEKMLTAHETLNKSVVQYRQFAPGVHFIGTNWPADELAETVRAFLTTGNSAVESAEVITFDHPDKDESGFVVAFPMDARDYLDWGWLLMERLHEACLGNVADEGCELLSIESEKREWIGGAAYPALYIRDTDKAQWKDHKFYTVKRGPTAVIN